MKTTLNSDLKLFVATGITSNTVNSGVKGKTVSKNGSICQFFFRFKLYAFAISAETSVGWGSEARVLSFTTNQKSNFDVSFLVTFFIGIGIFFSSSISPKSTDSKFNSSAKFVSNNNHNRRPIYSNGNG